MQVNFDTDAEALEALRGLEGDIAALHNHIASSIENPAHWGTERPALMVRELRLKQAAAASIRRGFYSTYGYEYKIGA